MIKVRVMAPFGFGKKVLDERYWMELHDNAKLSDLLRIIKMPQLLARAFFVSVNGAHIKNDTCLQDGDSVSFFPVAHGG